VGSNPTFSANKNRTFVGRQMFCFCLSKPQAWYIITARSVVYIIKGGNATLVSHHAPACILLRLDDIQCSALMIYRNKLRMIYKAYALICLQKCDIINSTINKKLTRSVNENGNKNDKKYNTVKEGGSG